LNHGISQRRTNVSLYSGFKNSLSKCKSSRMYAAYEILFVHSALVHGERGYTVKTNSVATRPRIVNERECGILKSHRLNSTIDCGHRIHLSVSKCGIAVGRLCPRLKTNQKEPSPAQHSTAQHSPAQHSTAQHSRCAVDVRAAGLGLAEHPLRPLRVWLLGARPRHKFN